ncbi:unnamed protein product [Rotaria magnacalcarata]|uniref:Uncharacterized protein n=2 Tax=Rotaria magnacalcarata TaxID=392030 RepID=A0A816VVX2_9BILA|nr:unnamed protein product [Rotaria magnacalcarata]CAF3726275.1 unnamed protein product [Rotaria magnacalcarata]
MKEQFFISILLIFIEKTKCSFWNEIPPRCIYDRTTLFSCWNTTLTHPMPLFNDLSYTLKSHNVQIRDSYFYLSLNDLFYNVGSNIETLSLLNNTFSSSLFNQTEKIYFRLLRSLRIHDKKSLQWYQLSASYFPQLIDLDLSYNGFTDEKILLFNQQNFPTLKYLNLSHNQLQSIDNLTGNCLNRIETLILSFNPLTTVMNKIFEFQSLRFLDLSSTVIKQLFSITLLPRLETFLCRQCQQIPMNEYENFLTNCSLFHNHLILDLTETNINSLSLFNPYMKCMRNLIFNNQHLINSVSTKDLLFSVNLENIQIRNIDKIDSIQFNVYDRLKSIDFNDNMNLQYVSLHLMSDYTYLQFLTISNTAVKSFSIDFNQTTKDILHVDVIDMSHSRLETLDFLKYLTFYTLDVSYNRLKIIDVNQIHFPHGMYELLSMNLLNLSSNSMEFIRINWENESPHTIDLSENNLKSAKLQGQSTYSLLLNQNRNLSIKPTTFIIDLPLLRYLNLNSIQFDSFENLIYLHNISNMHTLLLNNNQLKKQHRTLNWSIFYPWHNTLTHLSLQNISLENIDSGVSLSEYCHLLTIDFFSNTHLKCDCSLKPFINWLKTPPLPLADFYEPLNKVLDIECPVRLFDLKCDVRKAKLRIFAAAPIIGILILIVIMIFKLLYSYLKVKPSKPYQHMATDNDSIALTEQSVIQKSDEE